MKKKILLIPTLGIFFYLTLTSSAGGGAKNSGVDGTKATGGSGCSCHSYNTATTVGIELDSAGLPVTSYHPGQSYTIRLTGTNTGSTTLPYFGFQVTVVKAAGAGTSTAVLAGTLGTTGLPSSVRYTSASVGCGIDVLEQSSRIAATGSGATGSTYNISGLPWTAPVSGTGTVEIYACINAVNGSGSGGDHWNNSSTSITEAPSLSTVIANVSKDVEVSVYPNPFVNQINIHCDNAKVKNHVTIVDLNGHLWIEEDIESSTAINTTGWPAGIYTVKINGSGISKAFSVVKR